MKTFQSSKYVELVYVSYTQSCVNLHLNINKVIAVMTHISAPVRYAEDSPQYCDTPPAMVFAQNTDTETIM